MKEASFDDIALLASEICETPIAAVSLVDSDRQWFRSIVGMEISETLRERAFCDHAILQSGLMVVPDAQEDVRFADNPLEVGAPGIRFYAGAPLITPQGHAFGSLCVIDLVQRTLTAAQAASPRARHDRSCRNWNCGGSSICMSATREVLHIYQRTLAKSLPMIASSDTVGTSSW